MKNPKTDLNFPDTLKVETKDEYIKYILLYIIYYILYIQSLTLYVIQDDKLLDRLSTADLELRAFLVKTTVPGTYNLYLRPKLSKRELLEILCHEMVHLKQYESGKLKTSDNKIFY